MNINAFTEVRPIKVEVISPCLTFQADAPYSTRMRARTMQSAGMDVEICAYPASYPSTVGELGLPYCGFLAAMSASVARRMEERRRRWGLYWQFIVEPFHVMRFGCKRAVQRGCDVVFVADVEPWITFIFLMTLALTRYPLPLAGMIPGNYRICKEAQPRSLTGRLRMRMNYYCSKLLPHFMDVVGTSRHILSTLGLNSRGRVHVVPEGHENHVGERPTVAARERLKLPTHLRMVLLFGVAGRSKGADVLLIALESMPPDVCVCIVGKTGGVYEADWGSTERLMRLGWSDTLRIVDRYVSEDEMHDYYAACDAVVIPYKQGFAGTSTHLRRASEYGKAILACDQYHIGERVREYDLGLTFETGNPAALAACLRDLATRPVEWFDQVRQRSMRLLEDEAWAQVGNMYRRLFETMLAARKT